MLREIGRTRASVDLTLLVLWELTPLERHASDAGIQAVNLTTRPP
jgi:hypothetical protein